MKTHEKQIFSDIYCQRALVIEENRSGIRKKKESEISILSQAWKKEKQNQVQQTDSYRQ